MDSLPSTPELTSPLSIVTLRCAGRNSTSTAVLSVGKGKAVSALVGRRTPSSLSNAVSPKVSGGYRQRTLPLNLATGTKKDSVVLKRAQVVDKENNEQTLGSPSLAALQVARAEAQAAKERGDDAKYHSIMHEFRRLTLSSSAKKNRPTISRTAAVRSGQKASATASRTATHQIETPGGESSAHQLTARAYLARANSHSHPIDHALISPASGAMFDDSSSCDDDDFEDGQSLELSPPSTVEVLRVESKLSGSSKRPATPGRNAVRAQTTPLSVGSSRVELDSPSTPTFDDAFPEHSPPRTPFLKAAAKRIHSVRNTPNSSISRRSHTGLATSSPFMSPNQCDNTPDMESPPSTTRVLPSTGKRGTIRLRDESIPSTPEMDSPTTTIDIATFQRSPNSKRAVRAHNESSDGIDSSNSDDDFAAKFAQEVSDVIDRAMVDDGSSSGSGSNKGSTRSSPRSNVNDSQHSFEWRSAGNISDFNRSLDSSFGRDFDDEKDNDNSMVIVTNFITAARGNARNRERAPIVADAGITVRRRQLQSSLTEPTLAPSMNQSPSIQMVSVASNLAEPKRSPFAPKPRVEEHKVYLSIADSSASRPSTFYIGSGYTTRTRSTVNSSVKRIPTRRFGPTPNSLRRARTFSQGSLTRSSTTTSTMNFIDTSSISKAPTPRCSTAVTYVPRRPRLVAEPVQEDEPEEHTADWLNSEKMDGFETEEEESTVYVPPSNRFTKRPLRRFGSKA